jgi:hypothetical protein
MQETWQETPAAIPAPVDRECSEVLGVGFELALGLEASSSQG